eukprot:21747-Prymnesium_polylepis.1
MLPAAHEACAPPLVNASRLSIYATSDSVHIHHEPRRSRRPFGFASPGCIAHAQRPIEELTTVISITSSVSRDRLSVVIFAVTLSMRYPGKRWERWVEGTPSRS